MRTAEGAVARSSRELWADICAALPAAEQGADAREAFADSFAGAGISDESPAEAPGGRARARALPKPWAPLQDSAVYLASLERRLMRIKGLSQEVTSKDMLHTLAQAKKECWDRFLQEKFESEFYIEEHESDESTLEYLKRWLQPDKVAVSTEEIQCLIPPESHPDKQENEEEPPAAEQ